MNSRLITIEEIFDIFKYTYIFMCMYVYIISIYLFVYIHIYVMDSLESLDDHPPQSASARCFFPLGGFSRRPSLHAWSGGIRCFSLGGFEISSLLAAI